MLFPFGCNWIAEMAKRNTEYSSKMMGTEMNDEDKTLDCNIQCVHFTALSKSSSKVYSSITI